MQRGGGMIEAIEAYINQADEAQRADLIRVYETIRAVLPDEPERISWGMPTFGKNLIHFAAAKKHVGIYPGPEAVCHFEDTLRAKGYAYSKGAIQMPYGKVDLELVEDIARYCRDRR